MNYEYLSQYYDYFSQKVQKRSIFYLFVSLKKSATCKRCVKKYNYHQRHRARGKYNKVSSLTSFNMVDNVCIYAKCPIQHPELLREDPANERIEKNRRERE